MKILLRVLHGSVTFQMKVANFNEFQLTQPFLQNSCAHHKENFLNFSKVTLILLLALSKEELLGYYPFPINGFFRDPVCRLLTI